MGANDFTHSQAGSNPQRTFREARESAAWESGHGGYTGTLAEKDDFVIIDRAVRTLEQATAEAHRLISDDDPRISDKWGPAGALPYWDIPMRERSATVKVRVPSDAHTPATDRWFAERYITEAARSSAKAGETISNVKVDAPVKVKITKKTAATKGGTEKVFFVEGTVDHTVRNTAFPTMAAARKALDEAMNSAATKGNPASGRVTCQVRRIGDGALAEGSVTVDHADYEAEVTFAKPASTKVGEPTGWVFFGWASS